MGFIDDPRQKIKNISPQVHLHQRITRNKSLREQSITILNNRLINILQVQELITYPQQQRYEKIVCSILHHQLYG